MMDTIFSAGHEKNNRNDIIGLESSWFREAETSRPKICCWCRRLGRVKKRKLYGNNSIRALLKSQRDTLVANLVFLFWLFYDAPPV